MTVWGEFRPHLLEQNCQVDICIFDRFCGFPAEESNSGPASNSSQCVTPHCFPFHNCALSSTPSANVHQTNGRHLFQFFVTQGFLSFFTLFNWFEGHIFQQRLTDTWQEMFGVGGTHSPAGTPLWNCPLPLILSTFKPLCCLEHPLVSAEHKINL